MKEILNLSTVKLKRILALKTKIERLEAKLQSLAGGSSVASNGPVRKRRTMSAAARRKISLAQKARWAKQKGK